MARHLIYSDNNKFLSKLRFKSKTLNILRNIILSLVIILLLNWVIAITTDVNLLGTGFKKILEAMRVYNEAIPSIEIASDGWESQTPGSWHIDKSAKWTGEGKAQVTFGLNTKSTDNKRDIIFVLDTSDSMNNNSKIFQVKHDTIELLEELLADSANHVALVTFDSTARVVSEFTNDKDALISEIENLSVTGLTNYNDALLKAMDILTDYQPKIGTDTILLFLTDGYPCVDTPNQIGTFRLLKDKYPYVTVNGIQYEMGSSIRQEIKEVSDNQFYANMKNLRNVLFDASVNPEVYEKFDIVDYIDDEYFKVNTKDEIKVTMGTVDLTNESNGSQKITWHLSGVLQSGSSAKMTIDLTLKEKYLSNNGFYPTNKGEEITTKLPSEDQEKQKISDLTPVLNNNYIVTYDYNTPSGCSIKNVIEKHNVYEKVTKKSEKPICAGYLFKGWEIVEEDVTKVNDEVFIMPEHDVTLRGTWSTVVIAKSFNGEVHENLTLFKQVKQDAENSNGASIYTGEVTDEVGKTENTNIYYYTSKDHNNVIFADFCWQIVRTTATGGVKIIYNGSPENGTCKDDRTNYHLGITDPRYHLYISSTNLYSDSYTVDSSTLKFTLTGNIQPASSFERNELIGKYTCRNLTGTDCDKLYKVSTIDPEWSDGLYAIEYGTVNYPIVGTSKFSSNYKSPVYVGYMYNTPVEYKSDSVNLLNSFGPDLLFGNSVVKDDNGYTLQDTVPITNWQPLYYHYTCFSTSPTCSKVAYIYYLVGNYFRYVELETYNDINDFLMLAADDDITTDSDVKIVVDAWYKENMTPYTQYLEDTVFCNDRSTLSLGGWDPDGGNPMASFDITFNNYVPVYNYACPRIYDQFAMSNSKAKLTYPVGLITAPEVRMMGSTFANTANPANYSSYYWTSSPYRFSAGDTYVFNVSFGSLSVDYVEITNSGVRPVVSLNPGSGFSSGSGSVDDPYIVEPATK